MSTLGSALLPDTTKPEPVINVPCAQFVWLKARLLGFAV